MEHEDYMREALSLAREAAQEGEVPVGCVIVKDGEIIGRGRNRREELQRTSSHAEMEAIAQANERLRSWRLDGCTLYVTLEPCPMCAGAIVQARIPKVVIGAMNAKAGCAGSVLNILEEKGFNHQVEKITGVYIPFWLYDSQMNGNIQSRATQIRRWSSGNYDYTETSTFRCTRSGELEIEDLPVDSSTKFKDEIMDSIEPYNYSEFKPFNRSYLSGFLAEKYDLNKDEVYDRAKNRMENTMVDELKSTIRGYNSVTVDNSDVNINSGEVEYALLPVWMLNIKFKEKMYTFAMNGQTKKVVGTVPMDSGKVIKKGILFFGISFILFFIFNLMRGMM